MNDWLPPHPFESQPENKEVCEVCMGWHGESDGFANTNTGSSITDTRSGSIDVGALFVQL